MFNTYLNYSKCLSMKPTSTWCHRETITNADYANNLVPLANTHEQAKFLQHNLEQTARGIGLYMNSDKIEFMNFKQNGIISTWNGRPLKLTRPVYLLQKQYLINWKVGGPCGVIVNAMDCGIIVCEFALQSHYYIHFQANTLMKSMNPLILPAMG